MHTEDVTRNNITDMYTDEHENITPPNGGGGIKTINNNKSDKDIAHDGHISADTAKICAVCPVHDQKEKLSALLRLV